jgi:AraC family transcriptional regulator
VAAGGGYVWSMKAETQSFYACLVQRVVERVASSLDEALELDELAASAGLSSFHFHRIFRGMVGETPLELSRRLRLERAAWRLSRHDEAVTRVAFEAGYETHEGFTRAFRAAYGTAPKSFGSRRYPRIELAAPSGVHFDAAGQVPQFEPRHSGGQNMHVDIEIMPELRLGTIRHIGPYNQIPQAFERLGEVVNQTPLVHPGAALIAIWHDDPDAVPQDQLRSDAALVVEESAVLPPELVEQRIPAGRYARTTHIGPYELLGDVWARFMGEWLPASGLALRPTVSYELYRNTPAQVPREELRTELYLPLQS